MCLHTCVYFYRLVSTCHYFSFFFVRVCACVWRRYGFNFIFFTELVSACVCRWVGAVDMVGVVLLVSGIKAVAGIYGLTHMHTCGVRGRSVSCSIDCEINVPMTHLSVRQRCVTTPLSLFLLHHPVTLTLYFNSRKHSHIYLYRERSLSGW